MNQALEMARVAYQALDEKKGEDIRVIDISGISVIGDYFVITNGTSDSQVRALVDNVEEKMHKAGYELKEQEGNNSGTWVLLATTVQTGYFWITVISSFIFLTEKTVHSII